MDDDWKCGECGKRLIEGKVHVSYRGKVFAVDLSKCPSCGMVMVTEEMAMGTMAQAEELLEDK